MPRVPRPTQHPEGHDPDHVDDEHDPVGRGEDGHGRAQNGHREKRASRAITARAETTTAA